MGLDVVDDEEKEEKKEEDATSSTTLPLCRFESVGYSEKERGNKTSSHNS